MRLTTIRLMVVSGPTSKIKLADLTDLSSTTNIGQIAISSQINDSASGETLSRQHLLQQDLQTASHLMNQIDINRYDLDDKRVRGRFYPELGRCPPIRWQQSPRSAQGRHLRTCCLGNRHEQWTVDHRPRGSQQQPRTRDVGPQREGRQRDPDPAR